MINPSHSDPIWLIKKDKTGPAFDLAMIDVRHRFWVSSPNAGRTRETLLALNDLGPRPFFGLTRAQVNQLLACCSASAEERATMIREIIPEFLESRIPQLCSMLKLAFIRLWIEKQVILPLGWSAPINCDEILDTMIQEHAERSPNSILAIVRSINPVSAISYTGALTQKERELRATYWLRLVLASNLDSPNNFTLETAQDLKRRSFGSKSELARYYPDDFSIFVANNSINPWLREGVDKILADSRAEMIQNRKSNAPGFKDNRASKARRRMMSITRDYLESTNRSIESFATAFSDARHVNKAFNIEAGADLPGGLALLPEKVVNFCHLVNSTYLAFIRSLRLERETTHKAVLYSVIAYCGPYLYSFFMDRDGNLDNYPTTFNDFTCAIYVTADQDLVRDLGAFEKEPPETLLKMIEILADLNEWTPDTHYNRVYPIEKFFDYIVSQSAVVPYSDKVRNSFSPDCYPKLQKRWGTVKKPIPRAYFSTFLSMLDSLEYLTMHLNEMADGTMNGVINGELKCPNIGELVHGSDWAALWGIKGMSCEPIDLGVLNYSPIFYFDGKPRPFRYIPKFYRITEMDIDGKSEPRIIMNDVRITQLMCETGLRQQHLLWLDLDRYGSYVERKMRRPLAPLLVSSDKAHGAWTAIVSTKVIDLLDRQRDWYHRCTSPDFQQKIWYGLKKGSQFGQYKPLFRLSLSLTNWPNYDAYRLLLLCLQYFIKTEMEDHKMPDIVWCKPAAGEHEGDEPHYITDHTIEGLSSITASTLTSDYTPHGLRAGFVSEAIKFLPPSIVGQYLTGQSTPLVSYYSVFDESDLGMSHQEMLCMALVSNQDKLTAGDFPELAQAISRINQTLRDDIARDPAAAITKHRLMSLSNAKREMDTGLDRIIAREVSEFAFNPTHICPFNNTCPKEVIDLLGEPHHCSACPYAIRGIAHLPAISAKKDKYKEMMIGSLRVIDQYLSLSPAARRRSELEHLEHENDRFAREACLLEAIEQQLVYMHESGMEDTLVVKNKEDIVQHYQKLDLPEEALLLKRVIDVQNFPDSSSEDLNMKLAHLRHALLLRDGDLGALLGIGENNRIPMATKLAMQVSTMVKSGAIDVFEIYAASTGEHEAMKQLATVANDAPKLTQMVA